MSQAKESVTEAAVEAAAEAVGAVEAAGSWARAGRHAGLAGMAIGVVAAGAAAGVAVERLTVGRGMRRRARLALDAAGPYGSLRGTPGRARAEDGTELYYEIDDPAGGSVTAPQGGRRKGLLGVVGRRATAPTVVFCHGYCHNQDSWHFQREALRGVIRTVHWDQRSHGRSARGAGQLEGTEEVTIDLLGRDLKAVLDRAVPEGPIILVGHSMGGMTVMALADQFPDYVAERVVGVGLVGTSAGRLSEVAFGLPGLPTLGVKAFHQVVPRLLKVMGARTEFVERGRRALADVIAEVVKRTSFGTPKEVDPAAARFAERMIESTPIDVVAEFFPAFAVHDKTAALAAYDGVPALVLAGEDDMITPADHARAIAEYLPNAELVCVPGAGHLVMLERPELVSGHLTVLIERATEAARAARSARA